MLAKRPDATWHDKGPLAINRLAYKSDSKTTAPGVILYIYYTDETGHYTAKPDAKGWERRHGSIQPRMRTHEKGKRRF